MEFTSKKLLDVNLPRKLKLRDSSAFALLYKFAGILWEKSTRQQNTERQSKREKLRKIGRSTPKVAMHALALALNYSYCLFTLLSYI